MENKGKQFKGSGIKKYIKEDWEDDLGEEREDVVEYVISFEPGEYYDEYHGEFITEDKDEADDLFDELKEAHKLDQVSQYIEKTWEWDRINEEYYETDVDVYFNAGDELEFYGESKKTEGYSLGDDKESFDVYKHTAEFLNKVGKELEELGWKFNKEKSKFEKEDIIIDMEALQDNVDELYIGSNKLKLSKFADDFSGYEDIGEDTDIIYYVSAKAGDYEARQLASKINSCEKLEENKEVKTESLGDRYEVWQNYYEDGRTITEYVMSFDNYAEAQRFASGLMQDPDCDAWVEDKEAEESKKVEDRKIIESKLIVTNIKWDTDGEDIDLPKEMEVELPEYIDETDEDEVDEYVSDYISDETGFCHYGFDIKEVKTEAVMTSNKVSVYQIQETANCSYLFMGYDFAVENGGPDMNDYEKVAEVEIDTRDTDVTYVLDEVFTYGNTNIEYYDNNPKARSISVSDILEYNGNKYYVDSFGFKKLENTESKKVESEIKLEYKPVELGDTGENSWDTVTVYDGLTKQSIIALLDKRKIYELNFENGKKRLVKIYGVEWGSTAQCTDVLSGKQFKVDIKDMLQDGRVYETDYVTESKQVKTEDKQDNGISLSEAENKCKEVEKLLAEKLPDYNWLVNISAGQIIISDLNSKSDFRYTKKNGWGKSQKQVEDIVSQVFGTTATLDFYDSDVWAKHKAIVKGINILLPTNESKEKVDYSKFTPTNKVLSGNKGLSEDKIDEMRWALPDLFKNMTDEQKQIFEELSLRGMVMSCLIYGEDIHTSTNINAVSKYYKQPYVNEYYDKLGKDVTEEIIKQQTDYFKRGKVIRDVGTDSEGVTYNSFEEPEEESKKVTEAKQVNNMKINYNKIYDKFDVITPDGRALEEFDTEEEAIKWAKEQKDFISKKTEAVENLKIGDVVIVTPFDDDLYSSIYTDSEGKYTGRAAGVIYDLYNGKCDIVNVGIVDLYLDENNNYTGKYKFDRNFEHTYYTTLKGVPIKSRKVELVKNNDLKNDILYRYDIVMNSKSAPKEVLKFQQTTDSRYDKDAYMLLQKRLKELENKLNIKGVKFDYSEPSWIPGDGYDQWVSNCTVKKTAKNITWENIYEIVNSIKAVPYKLVVESKKTEAKPEEADKEIWEKVEKIVDLADNEIGPDQSNEYEYDEHIKFVIYRDFEFEDIFEVYTYLDGEAQGELDTGDVHLEDLDATMVDIVKKLQSKENLTETKYGDSNPDKIVPDAYCEIEKTDNGYYINCGIGTHTSLGGGNFTIYPEDYLSNLHKEVKKLAKERGIKRVYDKVKTIIPEYNAMIPEYNDIIENMIKDLTPFAEKSKQGQLTRADLDSIEEITGKITPNRMSTLPEFEWSGKFGRLRSLIGNLERYKTDLSNPLASADTITITESKEVKTEATVNKFQTLTLDKNGNEMLLKDTSYNHACSWLEKELAKAGSKVVDTETKGNKTIIKADNKTKFEYDEEKGTLKRLEEAEDMTQVKDDIETAVEKSDSTDLEKEQVKGSLDVLKTDEESAIEGYEDFKSETEKVADEELADAVNNQMEEIIDDEKEHIEKLDTIKSALGENKKTEAEAKSSNKKLDYKLDGFKGVTISVVDKKNGIDTEDYMEFDSMEFGIDEYEFEDSIVDGIKDILTNLYEFSDDYYDDRFTIDEITEMAEDITQDVLQLYDDLPDELIDFENGIANLGESKSITEEANTFGVAEDMYNRTHKDKWHTLSDDEKASYYNMNYKRIKKQADNLDKEEENKKITEAFWDDGKLYNYKGIDIQQSISDRGEKLYSILNNQEPFSIPDFSTLSAAKKYIDDNNLKSYKEKQESKKIEAKDLYGEWIDLLDKIPANRLEDYKIEYDLYDEQLNGDERPTEMILPKLIAGAKKYIKSEKVESIDPEAVKEKVEKAKADIGLKKAEEMIDTEKELTEGIKKEIIQYAKQQGLDVEKLQKQGQLDSVAEALDNIVGEMVSKTAVEYMDTTGKDIEWDFDISNNDIQVIIQ